MIDDRLEEWSEKLRQTLNSLEQGDVFEGLPFAYLGSAESAAFAPTLDADKTQPFDLVWIAEDEAPRFSIITTQTCDLCEEDSDRPRRPFMLVAPVYLADSLSKQNKFMIEEVQVSYLRRLTGPHFAEKFWVADLRIQIPFDKGIVLGRTAYKGFGTSQERDDFAQQLAELYLRPVLPGEVSQVIVDSLRTHFGSKAAYREQFMSAGIEEIRISCTDSPPYDVQLYVVVKNSEAIARARECFKVWYSIVEPKAAGAGIRLQGVEFPHLETMSAKTYARTHRLSLRFIRMEARPSNAPPQGANRPPVA